MLRPQQSFSAALLCVGFAAGAQAPPKGWAYNPIVPMRADLRAKAAYAMRHRSETKALAVLPPLTGAFKPVYPESVELLKALPGLDLRDGMIHVSAANAPELSQKLNAIQTLVARISWGDLFLELVKRHPGLEAEANDLSDRQWASGPPTATKKP